MSSDDYVSILHTLPEFAKRAPSRCLYRRRSVLERSAGAERRGTTIVLHSSLLQRCVAACLPPARGRLAFKAAGDFGHSAEGGYGLSV